MDGARRRTEGFSTAKIVEGGGASVVVRVVGWKALTYSHDDLPVERVRVRVGVRIRVRTRVILELRVEIR